MFGNPIVRSCSAVALLGCVLGVGLGLSAPAELSSPGTEALASVRAGACNQTANCNQNSVCAPAPGQMGSYFYYRYTGAGSSMWYDTADLYGLGQCRYVTRHSAANCSDAEGPNPPGPWWICS